MASWHQESLSWIRKQQLENPGLSQQEMKAHCSKNYPFRERYGYAYKSYLRAMRETFGRSKKPKKTNQIDIFENLK